MTIQQIVDIPADHWITLEVPKTVPEGKTILSFTPVFGTTENSPPTIEEGLQMAETKAADPNRKPLSRHLGKLKGIWEGDEV